jgi:predicted acyltransferase (DUF342 family)
MYIIIVIILFIFLFLLPFLPGIIELFRKQDAEPLFIAMEYIRNPRYFGKSFKRLIHRATAGFTLSPGMRDVKLSKDEKVELTHSLNISADREINHMLYVIGKFVSGSNAKFNKEVYVIEDAVIGANNLIQAFAGDGNVKVEEGVQFHRWLDAEGDIVIDENCNLGISASSSSKLCVARNCIFRRLFGMPIVTGQNWITSIVDSIESTPLTESIHTRSSFMRRKDRDVPPETVFEDNVVFVNDVKIGKGCIFKGSIKCYGKLVLEENVTIYGNVFTDGDILIGWNARIIGHVFSQMSIHISGQTVISNPDKIKSVIGKKSVNIEEGVIIYGYVATEGEGNTVEIKCHLN